MNLFLSPFVWTLAWSWLAGHAAPDAVQSPASQVATPNPVVASGETLATGFRTGRAPFTTTFGEERIHYDVMGVFVLPGEQVPIAVEPEASGFALASSVGTVENLSDHSWTWTAPSTSGPARIELRRLADGALVTLNAFVMIPYEAMKGGRVNGYLVGRYPRSHRAGVPEGFVEVTPQTAELKVAPHFELGQFVCKGGDGYPKYLVLQDPLLNRLENLLETVNRHGIQASTFQVMSAYRTPLYNKNIGNVTTFTRHQYGDAADIFVDEFPRDGRMDDLDGDRRLDRDDALVLYRLAEQTEHDSANGYHVGGLSAYEPSESHGPFVHVDTRGYRARW